MLPTRGPDSYGYGYGYGYGGYGSYGTYGAPAEKPTRRGRKNAAAEPSDDQLLP
jgi:hypothetical protein